MANNDEFEALKEQVKKLDKDMGRAFDRIRDSERDNTKNNDDIVELWDATKRIGKLGVLTTRGLAEVQGKHKIVCFLEGEFKDLVKERFTEHQANKPDKKKGSSATPSQSAAAGAGAAVAADVAPGQAAAAAAPGQLAAHLMAARWLNRRWPHRRWFWSQWQQPLA